MTRDELIQALQEMTEEVAPGLDAYLLEAIRLLRLDAIQKEEQEIALSKLSMFELRERGL